MLFPAQSPVTKLAGFPNRSDELMERSVLETIAIAVDQHTQDSSGTIIHIFHDLGRQVEFLGIAYAYVV